MYILVFVLISICLFFILLFVQMEIPFAHLTPILKERLNHLGIPTVGYAFKSFRSGMACTVANKQGIVKGGVLGAFYADSFMLFIQQAGRWTNTEWVPYFFIFFPSVCDIIYWSCLFHQVVHRLSKNQSVTLEICVFNFIMLESIWKVSFV